MPSEYRLIFFEPSEIAAGVVEWKRTQGSKVPVRKVIRIELDSQTLAAKLYFAEGKNKVPPLELTSVEVTAALLVYCRRAKIPLPIQAAKNLIRHDDHLAFMISMPSNQEGPMISVEYI